MGQTSTGDQDEDCSSPWEFSISSFVVENDSKRIVDIINEAREQHLPLTLVTEDGRVFPKNLLGSLSGNIMQIDMPLAWGDTSRYLRVFLRSCNGRWSFFRVAAATLMPFSLSVSLPMEIFILQRRSYARVSMPPGTVAILRKNGRFLNSLYVRDISPAGMLVCTGSPSAGIDVNALLNDIVISIPEECGRRGRTLPPIDRGQVVRSFFEKDAHIYCHAVAFNYESSYVRDALRSVSGLGETGLA